METAKCSSNTNHCLQLHFLLPKPASNRMFDKTYQASKIWLTLFLTWKIVDLCKFQLTRVKRPLTLSAPK